MPLYLFYTMVQKSQKWPKTQTKGSCLKQILSIEFSSVRVFMQIRLEGVSFNIFIKEDVIVKDLQPTIVRVQDYYQPGISTPVMKANLLKTLWKSERILKMKVKPKGKCKGILLWKTNHWPCSNL